MKLSKRSADVPASATIAVTTKAALLQAEGKDVIGFGAGQPDFDTPSHIVEAAKAAMDAGQTRYTPTPGTPELRNAIAEHMGRVFGLECSASEVMASCGGKHTLYNVMMSIVDPGDGVLLPAPYWVSYPVQIDMAQGITQYVETGPETAFCATAEAIDAACTDATKGLILNSPSNPTGAAYSREQLLEIAEVVKARDLWVVSDEMYARLTYDGYTSTLFATLPGMRDRTVTVYGLSKTYAMTGWRLGIAVAPTNLIGAMNRMQGQVTTNPASMVQAGGIAALSQPDDFLTTWLAAFDARRRTMVDRLNLMDGVFCTMPKGAFYAFPDFRGVLGKRAGDKVMETDWDLIDYLLDSVGVALVPGTPFGAPGFARLSYATSMDNILDGMNRIQKALSRLE